MSYELKIKAINLADEARSIKAMERKKLEKAKIVTQEQHDKIYVRADRIGLTMEALDVNSLAFNRNSQALVDLYIKANRILRKLKKSQISAASSANLRAQAYDLRKHRITVVRDEARATNIARGYLRGRTYVEMEGLANSINAAYNGVKWDRVHAMVMKYGNPEQRVSFISWLNNIGIEYRRKEIKEEKTRVIHVFSKMPEQLRKSA